MNRTTVTATAETSELARVFDPTADVPAGIGAAISGSVAAAKIVSACGTGMERSPGPRVEEELRAMRRRAALLRKDLIGLIRHEARAAKAVRLASRQGSDADRVRSLLFAAEVPLRTAESCQVLLNMALRVLNRAGVRAITEIGEATGLAYGGVVAAVMAARSHLSAIPADARPGAERARKRAALILREAEAMRTQTIDRVRRHLP